MIMSNDIKNAISYIDFKREVQLIAYDTFNSSIMSIQIGFTLATALAFNEYIKRVLMTTLNKEGATGYLKYAISVALLSGVVLSLTSRYVTTNDGLQGKLKRRLQIEDKE
jgi:hypothetical protein